MLPWLLLDTKNRQNSIISSFFARRAKKTTAEGRSPPQELEVGPRSGPYILVHLKTIWLSIFLLCGKSCLIWSALGQRQANLKWIFIRVLFYGLLSCDNFLSILNVFLLVLVCCQMFMIWKKKKRKKLQKFNYELIWRMNIEFDIIKA